MSGNFNERGRFPRGEDEQGAGAFYDSPYAPLVRGINYKFPFLEPGFCLDGSGYAGYTLGAEGGLKYDIILVRITPSAGTGEELRLATRGFSNAPTDPTTANQNLFFDGAIMELKVGKTCMNALTAGNMVGVSLSEVTIYNDKNKYDRLVFTQEYIGQPVVIDGLRLNNCTPWINGLPFAHRIFTGSVLGIGRAGKRITLTLGDLTNFGTTKLTEQKYDGAVNNGGTSLKDQPKPVCVGSVFNITPVYLGQVNLGAGTLPTYQVHYGAITDVTACRIRGAPLAKITSGTPTIGQYRPFNSVGQFQLGSTPSGAVTCDVDGATGGAIGFSSKVDNILRKLAVDITSAITVAKAPVANFSNVISLNMDAGLYVGPQKATLTEALNTVCDGTLVVAHGLRDGTMGAFLADTPTPPVFSLQDRDVVAFSELPLPDSLLPRPDDIETTYEFNNTRLSDIADTVTGDMRTYLGEQGRKLTIPTSVKGQTPRPRTLKFTTLFRDLTSATNRINNMKDFIARLPRVIEVKTPYFLGQVELGMTGAVTLTELGIQGRQMVVVEFQEDFVTGYLQMKLLG